MSKVKFKELESVVFSQQYLDGCERSLYGEVGTIMTIEDKVALVRFNKHGTVSVRLDDLEKHRPARPLTRELAHDGVRMDSLVECSRGELIRKKLVAQECDPELDEDIALAIESDEANYMISR